MADLITPDALGLLLQASSQSSSVTWAQTLSDGRTRIPQAGDVIATTSPAETGGVRVIRITIVDRVVESQVQTAPDEPVYSTINVYGSHADATVDQFGKITYRAQGSQPRWYTQSSSPSTVVLTGGPDGRFESVPVFKVKSSYEQVIRRDYARFEARRQPDTHVDKALDTAHESAKDNVPHITHDQYNSASSEVERMSDNDIRQLMQKYPRLTRKSISTIKTEVTDLLRAIQEQSTGHTALSFLSRDSHATTFFNEFSSVADEDVRNLTRDILVGNVGGSVRTPEPTYTVMNADSMSRDVQETLIDYWKQQKTGRLPTGRYQELFGQANGVNFEVGVTSPYNRLTQASKNAQWALDSGRIPDISLTMDELSHLMNTHLVNEHARVRQISGMSSGKDLSSILYLQFHETTDKPSLEGRGSGRASTQIEDITGIGMPDDASDVFGLNRTRRRDLLLSARNIQEGREARSTREALRAQSYNAISGIKAKNREITPDAIRNALLTLEGHLTGRTGTIVGGYQVEIGEGYTLKSSRDEQGNLIPGALDPVHDTVNVPIRQYNVAERGLTAVDATGREINLAELGAQAIRQLSTEREEMYALYSESSRTVEENTRLAVLEKRFGGVVPEDLKPTENIFLPRKVIAGLAGSTADKNALFEVSRRLLAMQMGLTVLPTADGSVTDTETHIEALERLLNETGVFLPTSRGTLAHDRAALVSQRQGKTGKAREFIESRIAEIDKTLADPEAKMGGYRNYLPDVRDYEKRTAGSANQAAVIRLNAFVKELQDEFYGGRKIDPRVLLSYGHRLAQRVRGEISATVRVKDDQGLMGTALEEVAQNIIGDEKIGEYKNSLGLEIAGGRHGFGNSLNLAASLMYDFLKGDPVATKSIMDSVMKASNLGRAYRDIGRASVTSRTVLGRTPEQANFDAEVESTDTPLFNEEGDARDRMEAHGGALAERADMDRRFTVVDVLRMSEVYTKDREQYNIRLRHHNESFAAWKAQATRTKEEIIEWSQDNPSPTMRATGFPTLGGDYVEDAAVNELRMGERLTLIADIHRRQENVEAYVVRERQRISADMENLRRGLPTQLARTDSEQYGQLRTMQESLEKLNGVAENEQRNAMRRLYGVRVTDDDRLAVVTPDDIERSLANKTPIHFFGTHEDDMRRVFGDKTRQEVLDIAHSVGLHAAVMAEGSRDANFIRPGDNSVEARLHATDQELQYSPNNMEALQQRAYLQAHAGEIGEARSTLLEAIKGNPSNGALLRDMAVLEDIHWQNQRPVMPATMTNPILRDAWARNTYQPYLAQRRATQTLALAAASGSPDRVQEMLERVRQGKPLTVDDITDPTPSNPFQNELSEEARDWASRNAVFGANELESRAVREMSTELLQAGVIRHMAFQGYSRPDDLEGRPQTPGAPKTNFAPSRTLEDRQELQERLGLPTDAVLYTERQEALDVAASDPKEIFRTIQSNPQAAALLGEIADAQGVTFQTDEGHRAQITSTGELREFSGATFPFGAEQTVTRQFTTDQFAGAMGQRSGTKTMAKGAPTAIGPDTESLRLYQVTGPDGYQRTMSYNYAQSATGDLLPDAHIRAGRLLRNQNKNIVFLDTETDYATRELRSTGVLKVNAKLNEMRNGSDERYTQSFYDQQKQNYFVEKKLDPALVNKDATGKVYSDAEFERLNPDFKFRASQIMKEHEQILHFADELRRLTRDGRTVIAASNASFDAGVLAARSRALAEANSDGPLANQLRSAADYFENVLPKRLIDTNHILQLAFPERTSTKLEDMAVDLHILKVGEQTHTALEDNRVAAEVLRRAYQTDLPKNLNIDEMKNIEVMAFTDEARSPFLVHKILPIDTAAGREKVQILGAPISFEELSRGDFSKAQATAPRVMHELMTGYQLSQRMDQGRLEAMSREEATARAEELKTYQDPAIDDHARRMVRNAISPGEKSRADWREISVLRGQIAAGYQRLVETDGNLNSYMGQIFGAIQTRTAVDGIDFSQITESQAKHFRGFMSSDPEGTIEEAGFRKAVIKAGKTLEGRAAGVDKYFLENVPQLLRNGTITGEQYMEMQRNYTSYANRLAPPPQTVPEWRQSRERRSVTLTSKSSYDGRLKRTEVDLTQLDRDDVERRLREHSSAITQMRPNANAALQEMTATRRVFKDLVIAAPEAFRNVSAPRTMSDLANVIVGTATTTPTLGYREQVLADDTLDIPRVAPDFGSQVQRRINYALNGNVSLPEGLARSTSRIDAYEKEKKRRQDIRREATEQAVSTAQTETPSPVREVAVIQNIPSVPNLSPLPESNQTVENILRDVFTNTVPQVSAVDARTAVGVTAVVGGISLALLALQQAGRNSQREAGAGDSDEDPLTPDRVNRSAERDLRDGQAGDEAAEGYRKLHVNIRGMHLGLGGSRLSEEAFQGIANDVSATLQKHLGAELDPDGSVYNQTGASTPMRPNIVSAVMGRILSRR